MSLRPRAPALLALASLLVWCAPGGAALAQPVPSAAPSATPPPAPSEEPSAAPAEDPAALARVAHLRGLAARDRGDWSAAHDAFLDAWKHKRHWEIAVNLGEAEMRTGRYENALGHLAFAVGDPGFSGRSKVLVDRERATVEGWIRQVRAKIESARDEIPAPTAAALPSSPGEGDGQSAARPNSAPSGPYTTTWALTVGAGVGLGVGGVVASGILFALAGNKTQGLSGTAADLPGKPGDPIEVRCAGSASPTCAQLLDHRHSADQLSLAGGAALGLAGTIGLATLVFALLVPARDSAPPIRVAPAMGSSSVGLVVLGAF